MTPSFLIRPVLVLLAASTLAGCGMVGDDANRFETLAESVAAVPLDGDGRSTQPSRAKTALRPAIRVEVMDPHALWDARDADMNSLIDRAGPSFVAAAAPVAGDAVLRQVSARIETAAARTGLRPALKAAPVAAQPTPSVRQGLVQLGAYSSEASARAAWSRLKNGQAAGALDGLSPVYEAVEVGGRHLTRLKVRPPAAGAGAVCAAAGVDVSWCQRAS